MEQEIKKVIEANLPAQVGAVLNKRLSELERKEKELEDLKVSNSKLIKKYEEACEKISKNRKMEERMLEKKIDLEAKEKTLNDTIHQYEIDKAVLDVKQINSRENLDRMERIFKVPFQNRIVRESSLKSIPVSEEYIQQGQYDSKIGRNTENLVKCTTIEGHEEKTDTEEG